MNKTKPFQKRIAIVLLAVFIPSLLPVNMLYASNNGPKAPEAASFEPVDATDMVNLITGQYSYVLPLLNIPSPEGGYPLALSYHAGIAMDQQASWTGLGWNVNPGAIDRAVNGYPDDYKGEYINEYYYDLGGEETAYYLSVGYSTGMTSVGLGFNWGSNQSLGGQVSLGLGFNVGNGNSIGVNGSLGTSGSSLGVGAYFNGGLSIGANISKNGVGVNAGFNSNGSGFNIGYNTSGSFNMAINPNNATGFSVSTASSSVGSSVGALGVGMSVSNFHSSSAINNYGVETSNSNTSLYVPTPIGVFSLSFGSQRIRYQLGKNRGGRLNGPIHFNNYLDGNNYIGIVPIYYPNQKYVMDIYEVPLSNNELSNSTNVENNNPVFPAYDNYNIQSQGISGSMSSMFYENGALFGFGENYYNQNGFRLRYGIQTNDNNAKNAFYSKFDSKPYFYMENEISNFLDSDVNPAYFNANTNNNTMFYYYNGGADQFSKPRRKTSTFVQYYTNEEILNNLSNLNNEGFLETNATGFNRTTNPEEGIGAFKITAKDGKTYHYSLPVYNHEIVTRSFGKGGKPENESHVEKYQLQSYATHWLLTAVTGPDFVDNGDGVAGDGDLGYWTSFDYGLWSDTFAWKAPYKKDYIIDEQDPEVKTWIKGRKQVYYLDKIKTRTHTALFIKSPRNDSASPEWKHDATKHSEYIPNLPYDNSYTTRFTIPSQKQLKLNKIILLKNDFDNSSKNFSQNNGGSTLINYQFNTTEKPAYNSPFNIFNNVLDENDNINQLILNSIKVINFEYDYSLVSADNRLTLKSVNFSGKMNNNVLPPYKFNYNNSTIPFNIDNQDGWGYLKQDPKAYSLNEIVTPLGAKIKINYENNSFKSATPHEIVFKYNDNQNQTLLFDNIFPHENYKFKIKTDNNYNIQLGNVLSVDYYLETNVCGPPQGCPYCNVVYSGTATIIQDLGNNEYLLELNNISAIDTSNSSQSNACLTQNISYTSLNTTTFKLTATFNISNNSVLNGGGIRTSKISVINGTESNSTEYKYGINQDGIGYVSYIPYAQNLAKELAYSSELPAPRVMYEYVSVMSGNNNSNIGKQTYKFNVLKQKDPIEMKFGDFYEITKNINSIQNYQSDGNSSLAGYRDVNIGQYVIKDNLSSIGQLLENNTYNSNGDLLYSKINRYYSLSDFNNNNNIGVTKESYQTYKLVDYQDVNKLDKWNINSSTRISYPSISKSFTTKSTGYTFTTEFKDYDLISGVAKEIWSTSSDGKSFKTKIIPAYLKYPQMGSKVDSINNKNMLSQTAAEYSYILDGGVWKETGVGITTWNNEWGYKDIGGYDEVAPSVNNKIWRKHKSFTWNGTRNDEGIITDYDDTSFDWGVGAIQTDVKWKQLSEITLYDHYSMPLEMKDVNGNKASTKMGDNETKIMTTGNAGYNEMYYSGGENIKPNTLWLEPELTITNASQVTNNFYHTGKKSLATTSSNYFGVTMKNGQHRGGKYKVSVWVKKDNAAKALLKVNNVTTSFQNDNIIAGDWQLKTAIITVPTGTCTVFLYSSDASTVYYDDLMIRPIASSISGYVYNEYDELTHIINNNGLATRFEYDAAGRLIKTYVEVIEDIANGIISGGFKLQSENKYNYKSL